MRDTSDSELVDQVRDGSTDAIGELFRRHWERTWQVAYGLCGRPSMADDMAQDAFERAMGALATFNGRSSFGTWVQRIVVNRTIDELRRERRIGDLPDEMADPRAPGGSHVDPAVMRAVARLAPERRAPIVLKYWFDYTTAEIAEALGVPLGTVASRLSRALDELRATLEDDHA